MYKIAKRTKILLELIKNLGIVAGYKINIQKPVAFLDTNNESKERECREIGYLPKKTRKTLIQRHT